ncbi:MAG: glucose-1-phosphate thymidylyltransferase [Flavobacteriales bacterium BRH_c54]|nr:MAG: glucose-1-phosphate thymidylyltransferase [Flavobacteriales bacterium BRH_c54]
MNVIFFETNRESLLPLVFAKPIAKLRVGITTIEEKWMDFLSVSEENISYLTETYLSKKFKLNTAKENLFINGSFLPTSELVAFIKNELQLNEALICNDEIVVAKTNLEIFNSESFENLIDITDFYLTSISTVTDIFTTNHEAIEQDFERLTKNKKSAKANETNTIIGNKVFIEEGATITGSILNSNFGAIYISKNAEIMEGSLVRGPFALCENATLKMGTKIYGATTIGPHSKVGGEVNNSVIQGYSNKGHDGFLGNSVIGEWCNLGADTNNSNLKNNYGEVKLWDYTSKKLENTRLQFCGLIMGDHTKCGINTMFNTGTIAGFSANIYGSGFQDKFIPSFSWGGNGETTTYQLEKALETAEKVMERRGILLTKEDKAIFAAIHQQTSEYRK